MYRDLKALHSSGKDLSMLSWWNWSGSSALLWFQAEEVRIHHLILTPALKQMYQVAHKKNRDFSWNVTHPGKIPYSSIFRVHSISEWTESLVQFRLTFGQKKNKAYSFIFWTWSILLSNAKTYLLSLSNLSSSCADYPLEKTGQVWSESLEQIPNHR